MSSHLITAVALGADRVSLGTFSRKGDRMVCAGLAAEAHEVPASDEQAWLEQTRAALLRLGARSRAPGSVVLVLPAHLLLAKLVKVPRVAPAKREQVLRFEAEQAVPCDLAEVVWAGVTAGEREQEADMLLVAAKLAKVEPLCAAVAAAGFDLRALLPAPLATLAVFRLRQAESPQAALVAAVGFRAGTLVHVEGGRFAVRTFLSGWSGTKEDQATNLAHEITRTTLYFRREIGLNPPVQVWLAGDRERLAGWEGTLSARLKAPAGWLDPSSVVAGVESRAGEPLLELAGAAATELWPGQTAMNLLPPRWRLGEGEHRRLPWLIATGLLLLLAMLPPLLHFRAVAAETRAQAEAMERELAPARERNARNRANLQRLDQLRGQIGQLQAVLEQRTGWLALLADLQDRLARVEDVWLDRLAVISPGGDPLRLRVSGRMLSRAGSGAPAKSETGRRVQALLAGMADSPFVAQVESERFEPLPAGILKFEFVLVADPARPF